MLEPLIEKLEELANGGVFYGTHNTPDAQFPLVRLDDVMAIIRQHKSPFGVRNNSTSCEVAIENGFVTVTDKHASGEISVITHSIGLLDELREELETMFQPDVLSSWPWSNMYTVLSNLILAKLEPVSSVQVLSEDKFLDLAAEANEYRLSFVNLYSMLRQGGYIRWK